ncbi:MAG: hypothetical protein NWE91_07155 [Candidatus Bathyarchaeota archaeon]|nr:hypothetical protein [Candidatus Bathyarchaeota archaeon]
MGKINVVLKDKLEEKFRRTIFERKGMKKGNISEAIEEAIDLWIKQDLSKPQKEAGKR